jgi:T5SS/PEP-CTERM-associated repeat protein
LLAEKEAEMSDLWVQVDLTLTGNFSTLVNGAPVNDMANVVQTIGGQAYLLSLSTSINFFFNTGPAVYGNGQGGTAINGSADLPDPFVPSNLYYPWAPLIRVTQVLGSYDVSALNDVSATMNDPGGFPNSIGAPFFASVPGGIDAITTLLTISGIGQTITVPTNVSASSYIPNFYAPTITTPEVWSDPNTPAGTKLFTEFATVYYPEYVWVDLGPVPSGSLFTSGADTVNFNGLTSTQQSAVASGADLYHGLGGNDVVTLPSAANYNESLGGAGGTLNWDSTRFFYTGSGPGDTYAVYGSDGSYNIALGAGSDTVTITGNGNSNITAGSGSDTITIDGTGSNSVTIGSGPGTLSISGGGKLLINVSGGTINLDSWSGMLNAPNGNTITAPIFDLGYLSGSVETATMDNASFNISGSFTIGDGGSGTLSAQNNASISAGSYINIGGQDGSVGKVTLDNSTLNDSGPLTVGTSGSGTLDIQNNATVSAATLVIAYLSSGSGTLTIQSGTDVTAGTLDIAFQPGSKGIVSIDNSALDISGPLNGVTVGNGGSGSLTVQNKASMSAGSLDVGYQAGSDGSVRVDNSALDISGPFTVGDGGSGTLTFQNGTTISATDFDIGYQSGSVGNASLDDSKLDISGPVTVGDGGSGTLIEKSGSTITVPGFTVAFQNGSSGSLTVDNSKVTASVGISSGAGDATLTVLV